MQKKKIIQLSSHAAALIFLALIAYLPFHIFLSTVIGVNVGGLEFLKASKDIAVFLIVLLTMPYVIYNWVEIKNNVLKDKITILIIIYITLSFVYFIVNHNDFDSSILGLIYNTRFLIIFVFAGILTRSSPGTVNSKIITRIIIVSSLIVAILGILQYFILPKDILAQLGYSMKNGALPSFYIDDKPDFFRIMSTMRDPNTLGSYLLIPISLMAAKLLLEYRKKTHKKIGLLASMLIVEIFALALAFSRSAVVGLIVSIFVFVTIVFEKAIRTNTKKIFILGISFMAIFVIVGSIVAQSNSRQIQNIIFHADEQTVLRDPNELRIDFLKRSVVKIYQKPLGSGLGTAGLASMKNQITGVYLTENYYLQIGLEVGILGLLIFIMICFMVLRRLLTAWHSQNNYIIVGVIASFAGLAVTNALAHIWTNETIAIIWWGLAAVCIAQYGQPASVKK